VSQSVATGLLAPFASAGVLSSADLHVARRLGSIVGEADESVLLAAAFAVRGPRLGHVCVDLTAVSTTVTVEGDDEADLSALPWPSVESWLAAVAASPLVADRGPLHLEGTLLYLDRYWREERQVAADLLARVSTEDPVPSVVDKQQLAVATAASRLLTVIAGGPGTGKTTTIAKIIERLKTDAAASGSAEPLIALAAPTGKAAARLQEATGHKAMTLHRLLGYRPGKAARFKHDRSNRLPHDVVIVDETSMVSLTHMARLLEAVRPDARLVLVGDPDQLASVEAGAVLGDIVASELPDTVVLDKGYRFAGGIQLLAEAIKRGDPDEVISVLDAGHDDVVWIDADPTTATEAQLAPIRDAVVTAGTAVVEAARAGDGEAALAALGKFRLLCAHRRGPYGVTTWTARVESWLSDALGEHGPRRVWYPGQPLLFTTNDYGLRLFNGDTGVVIQKPDGSLRAVFERDGKLVELSPHRLDGLQTVHAMTIHRAQGSQFGLAAVVLPAAASQVVTRELLYTALTRPAQAVLVIGSREAINAAVAQPIGRASGLATRVRTSAGG
jgi:exodeoxyribonuclease V alpha subunit